jgi:hypothetical protein
MARHLWQMVPVVVVALVGYPTAAAALMLLWLAQSVITGHCPRPRDRTVSAEANMRHDRRRTTDSDPDATTGP